MAPPAPPDGPGIKDAMCPLVRRPIERLRVVVEKGVLCHEVLHDLTVVTLDFFLRRDCSGGGGRGGGGSGGGGSGSKRW